MTKNTATQLLKAIKAQLLDYRHISKRATKYVLQKKLFLKFFQYSQGKHVLETLFTKVEGLKDCNFVKKRL